MYNISVFKYLTKIKSVSTQGGKIIENTFNFAEFRPILGEVLWIMEYFIFWILIRKI